jgi:hypothetical protein
VLLEAISTSEIAVIGNNSMADAQICRVGATRNTSYKLCINGIILYSINI